MLAELAALSATDLLDLHAGRPCDGTAQWRRTGWTSAVSPAGYRLLARVPRLPGAILDRIVEHFGGLQKLLGRDGGGPAARRRRGRGPGPRVRARSLSRLAEASIIDRYP